MPMPRKKPQTMDDRLHALAFLRDYSRRVGFMPSQREIAEELGWANAASANVLLARMEAEGLLTIHRPAARAITITAAGMAALTEAV